MSEENDDLTKFARGIGHIIRSSNRDDAILHGKLYAKIIGDRDGFIVGIIKRYFEIKKRTKSEPKK